MLEKQPFLNNNEKKDTKKKEKKKNETAAIALYIFFFFCPNEECEFILKIKSETFMNSAVKDSSLLNSKQ